MSARAGQPTRRAVAGFSLIELLVVVAIIAILAAVLLPFIIGYLRIYKLQGAAQTVAGEIQTARLKAITKSVNMGVAFLPGYPAANQFQWILEDSTAQGGGASYQRLPAAARSTPASGPPNGYIGQLPDGVSFVAAGTGRAIRFDRLGTACNVIPGAASPCPGLAAPDPGGSLYIDASTGDMVMTLLSTTGLRKTIVLTPGGRVRVQ